MEQRAQTTGENDEDGRVPVPESVRKDASNGDFNAHSPLSGRVYHSGARFGGASVFEDVYAFQVAMGLPMPHRPELIQDPTLEAFRQKFLSEELQEYFDAVAAGDLVKAVDALHDLIYVASGTLGFMGLSPFVSQTVWATIQEANLRKRRATSDAESKRACGQYDVVKPLGWQSPEPAIRAVLVAGGADLRRKGMPLGTYGGDVYD